MFGLANRETGYTLREQSRLESFSIAVSEALMRKRAETEAKRESLIRVQSEEKHRSLFELAPLGIITSDMRGVITAVNPAYTRITGYTSEDVVGKYFTKLASVRVRDIPKYVRVFTSLLRGDPVSSCEFRFFKKGGEECWGEIYGSLLEVGGKKIGVQAILQDVSMRKQVEEDVRKTDMGKFIEQELPSIHTL